MNIVTVVIVREYITVILISFLLFGNLSIVLAQNDQGLKWSFDMEEDFLMYEIVFRNENGGETEVPINITIGTGIPTIPDAITNWSQIPSYPINMRYVNGTEFVVSDLFPNFSLAVVPTGNWEILSELVEDKYGGSIYFSIDNYDSDFWSYGDEWKPNSSIYGFGYSYTYSKEDGLFAYGDYWMWDTIEGGHPLWQVLFKLDREYNSPLPAIYITYVIIGLVSLVAILIWVKRTNRF